VSLISSPVHSLLALKLKKDLEVTSDRYGSFLGYALSTIDRRGGRTRMIRLFGSVRQRYGHRESDYGEGSDSHLNP
jgi:hypothetical protein